MALFEERKEGGLQKGVLQFAVWIETRLFLSRRVVVNGRLHTVSTSPYSRRTPFMPLNVSGYNSYLVGARGRQGPHLPPSQFNMIQKSISVFHYEIILK